MIGNDALSLDTPHKKYQSVDISDDTGKYLHFIRSKLSFILTGRIIFFVAEVIAETKHAPRSAPISSLNEPAISTTTTSTVPEVSSLFYRVEK